METIKKGIQLAMEEFRKEFGEDAKLEDGDRFATIFNDAVLIIELEDKTLSYKILAGDPYKVDYNLNLLEKEG